MCNTIILSPFLKDPTASYKKPPNLQGPAALAATKSFPTLPQLPTTPLPQSQLPPDSVRVPPPHLPTTIPAALSSLTPIPLKDLNRPPIQAVSAPLPQNPTPSITASGGLISIQVPLKVRLKIYQRRKETMKVKNLSLTLFHIKIQLY